MIKQWKTTRPCPKCGGEMGINELIWNDRFFEGDDIPIPCHALQCVGCGISMPDITFRPINCPSEIINNWLCDFWDAGCPMVNFSSTWDRESYATVQGLEECPLCGEMPKLHISSRNGTRVEDGNGNHVPYYWGYKKPVLDITCPSCDLHTIGLFRKKVKSIRLCKFEVSFLAFLWNGGGFDSNRERFTV